MFWTLLTMYDGIRHCNREETESNFDNLFLEIAGASGMYALLEGRRESITYCLQELRLEGLRELPHKLHQL